jgi:hypothetical protein
VSTPHDWEIKLAPRVTWLETKDAADVGGLMLDPGDPEGTAWILAAVTGVVDDVNDIILPGAFERTLKKRQVKGCVGHNWERQAAIQKKAIELLPGDPRLPKFVLAADGSEIPWPAEAGALAVKAEYILDSTDGKDAWARHKAAQGQQQYSIGYKVNPDKTEVGPDGIRRIGDLDVYEFSDVLHGAHPLARGIGVKDDKPTDLEYKVRYVRDQEYWGYPIGTPITAAMKPRGNKARSLRRAGRPAPATAGVTTAPPKRAPKAPKPLAARERTQRNLAPVDSEVDTSPALFEEPPRKPGSIVRASRRATGDINAPLENIVTNGLDDIASEREMARLVREGATPDDVREGLAARMNVDLNPDPNSPRPFAEGDNGDATREELDYFMEDYTRAYEQAGQAQTLRGDDDPGADHNADDPRLDAMFNLIDDFHATEGDGIDPDSDTEKRLALADQFADRGDNATAAALIESAMYSAEWEGADISSPRERKLRALRAELAADARDVSGESAVIRARRVESAESRTTNGNVNIDDIRAEVAAEQADLGRWFGVQDANVVAPADSFRERADEQDTGSLDEAVRKAALGVIAAHEGSGNDPGARERDLREVAQQNGLDERDVADEVEAIASALDESMPQEFRDAADTARRVNGNAAPDAPESADQPDVPEAAAPEVPAAPAAPEVPAAPAAPEVPAAPAAPAVPEVPAAPAAPEVDPETSALREQARGKLNQAGTKRDFAKIAKGMSDDEMAAAVDAYQDTMTQLGSDTPNQRHQLALDELHRRRTAALAKGNNATRREAVEALSPEDFLAQRRMNASELSRLTVRGRGADRPEVTRRQRLADTFDDVAVARDNEANPTDGPGEFNGRNVISFIGNENMDTDEIAQAFGVRQPRALTLLNKLEADGFVHRNLGDNADVGEGSTGAVSGGRRRVEALSWETSAGRDGDVDEVLSSYDRDHPDEVPADVRESAIDTTPAGAVDTAGDAAAADNQPDSGATDAEPAVPAGEPEVPETSAVETLPSYDELERGTKRKLGINTGDRIAAYVVPWSGGETADRPNKAGGRIVAGTVETTGTNSSVRDDEGNVFDFGEAATVVRAKKLDEPAVPAGEPDGPPADGGIGSGDEMDRAHDAAIDALAAQDADALTDALVRMGVPESDDPGSLADALIALPPDTARERLDQLADFNTDDNEVARRRLAAAQAAPAEPAAPAAPEAPAGNELDRAVEASTAQDSEALQAALTDMGVPADQAENLAGDILAEPDPAAREQRITAIDAAGGDPTAGAPATDEPTAEISPEEVAAAEALNGQVDAGEITPGQASGDQPAPAVPETVAPQAVAGPNPADVADAAVARIESDEVDAALDTAAANAFGLTEADDGELEVDLDIADRQDRVESLLAADASGDLALSELDNNQLGNARRDLVSELALQGEISRRDRRNNRTAAPGGAAAPAPRVADDAGGDAEIRDVDTSAAEAPEVPEKPKRRPGLAGSAEDYADAIESGNDVEMVAGRARLESSLRRSQAAPDMLAGVQALLDAAGPDGHPDPAALRTAADAMRAAARERRNSTDRNRRTVKRLERERIRSLIGQINVEMRGRGMRPEQFGGIVPLDREQDGRGNGLRTVEPLRSTAESRQADRARGINPVTRSADSTVLRDLPPNPVSATPDVTAERLRARMAEPLVVRGKERPAGHPDRYQWDTAVIAPGGNLYAVKDRQGAWTVNHASGLSIPDNGGIDRMSAADMRVYLDALERGTIDGQQLDWSGEGREVAQRIRDMNVGRGTTDVGGTPTPHALRELTDAARGAVAARYIAAGKPEHRVVGDIAAQRHASSYLSGDVDKPNSRGGDHMVDNALEALGRTIGYGRESSAYYAEQRNPEQMGADKLTERVRLGARNAAQLGAPDKAIAMLEARADALADRDDADARGATALREAAAMLRLRNADKAVLPHAQREAMLPGDQFVVDVDGTPQVWVFDGRTGGTGYGQQGGFIATGPNGETREFRTGLGGGMRTGQVEILPTGVTDDYRSGMSARDGRMLPINPGDPVPADSDAFVAAHDAFVAEAFGLDNEAAVDDARAALNAPRAAAVSTPRGGGRRSAPRRTAAAQRAQIPNEAELATVSADNRRAVLGRLADSLVLADDPIYSGPKSVDEVLAGWSREENQDNARRMQTLAGATGRWSNAKLSDGGLFIVDRDGVLTHTPSGMTLGSRVDGLNPAHALRVANLLERARLDGEELDWRGASPPAVTVLRRYGSRNENPVDALRRYTALDPAALPSDWTRTGIDSAVSVPNPDALTGAIAQMTTTLDNYRPGRSQISYATAGETTVARRTGTALSNARDLARVDPHRAASILADAIGRDGDTQLDPEAPGGRKPGKRSVRELLTPVLDQLGLSADATRRTEISKLREARGNARITVGPGASITADRPSAVGAIADKRAAAAATIANNVAAAVDADGIELIGGADGRVEGIRLSNAAKLGIPRQDKGDTADHYLIMNQSSRTGLVPGDRNARVQMDDSGTLSVTFRQDLGEGGGDNSVTGADTIVRLQVPPGSWKIGTKESIEQAGTDDPESVDPKLTKLDDDAYASYTDNLQGVVAQALADGQATDRQHTVDDRGEIWSPERAALHDEIVEEVWQANFANVPNEGKALFSGGLGGSGKGTALKKLPGDVKANYATIDPDGFKEALAARGMVPDVEGMAPMEGAALIHEESSHLAKMIAARALAERKNVIYDQTMASEGSVTKRLDALAAAGYEPPQALFVDVPIEVSQARALSRHRNGLERYRNGEGYGGRFISPSIIAANATDQEGFNSNNRVVFESLKSRFSSWSVYDNSVSGRDAVLLQDNAGRGIGDQYSGPDGWDRYQADQVQAFLDELEGRDSVLGDADWLGPDGKPLPDDQQPARVLARRARQAGGSLAGQPGAQLGAGPGFGDGPPQFGGGPAFGAPNPGAGQLGGLANAGAGQAPTG